MSSLDVIGGDAILKLPSGRPMRYFDVRKSKVDGITCSTELGGDRKHFYGAKFVENMCQGLARDIFYDRLLELERRGFVTVLQVHDEVVIRCRSSDASRVEAQVRSIMRTPPAFMPANFPLDSEVIITDRYRK
jgi:DNA polymerase